MGRPRKPTALKRLEGNTGHRPLPEAEPQPDTAPLDVPAWLSERAQAVWAVYAPPAAALGLLTVLDTMSFATWCQSAADYAEATEMLATEGSVVLNGPQEIPSPWHSIRSKALQGMIKIGSRFGMTPSDRAALGIRPQEPDDAFSLWEKKYNVNQS